MQTIHINRPPLTLPDILTRVLPIELYHAITHCNAPTVEELRLHSGRISTVTSCGKSYSTDYIASSETLSEILKLMCAGSLYAYGENICQGYLTMDGGIRVGVCGTAATQGGRVIGVDRITGLIVRIPHRVTVDASPLLSRIVTPFGKRGMLIYAPPGVGKSTLLRAIAERASSPEYGVRTVLVDTREELCCTLDGTHLNLDILIGYPRELGIEIAVRSMGAELIICDEIGNEADAEAILSAANCGAALVASAHAESLGQLLARPAIRRLHNAEVFRTYTGLRREHERRFRYELCDLGDAQVRKESNP